MQYILELISLKLTSSLQLSWLPGCESQECEIKIPSTHILDFTPQETMDMVSPAMQLAQKIPDKKLQVWAASLLAGWSVYPSLCAHTLHTLASYTSVWDVPGGSQPFAWVGVPKLALGGFP